MPEQGSTVCSEGVTTVVAGWVSGDVENPQLVAPVAGELPIHQTDRRLLVERP